MHLGNYLFSLILSVEKEVQICNLSVLVFFLTKFGINKSEQSQLLFKHVGNNVHNPLVTVKRKA